MVRRIAEEYELVKWQWHFVRSDPWLKISQIFFELARVNLLRPEIDFLISWQSTSLCQANRIERNYLSYIVDCFPPGTE